MYETSFKYSKTLEIADLIIVRGGSFKEDCIYIPLLFSANSYHRSCFLLIERQKDLSCFLRPNVCGTKSRQNFDCSNMVKC